MPAEHSRSPEEVPAGEELGPPADGLMGERGDLSPSPSQAFW